MNFDQAFEELIGNEGVLSLDPNDKGNWTGGKVGVGTLKGSKYGISAASYPSLDIRNLTLEQVKAIYLTDYWSKHHIDSMPEGVRFDVFDGVVNSGPGSLRFGRDGAIRWIQRAIGVVDDGVVGPKTLAALAAVNSDAVVLDFNAIRLNAMTYMGGWPTQGRGWARRICSNLKELSRAIKQRAKQGD